MASQSRNLGMLWAFQGSIGVPNIARGGTCFGPYKFWEIFLVAPGRWFHPQGPCQVRDHLVGPMGMVRWYNKQIWLTACSNITIADCGHIRHGQSWWGLLGLSSPEPDDNFFCQPSHETNFTFWKALDLCLETAMSPAKVEAEASQIKIGEYFAAFEDFDHCLHSGLWCMPRFMMCNFIYKIKQHTIYTQLFAWL